MKKRDPNSGVSQPDSATPMDTTYVPGASAGYSATDTAGTQSPVDTAKEKAGQVTDKAQEIVGQVTDQAQHQAVSQISTRKKQAADSLTDVSQAVNQVGTQLHQNDHEALAQYASLAAQQVSRMASYLREHDVNEIVDEVQGLARRQPAIFLAGAFALGLLGARFLKSSSPQTGSRYRFANPRPYTGQHTGAGAYSAYGPRSGYASYGGTNGAWGGTPDRAGASQGMGNGSYGSSYDPGMRGSDVRRMPE